MQGFTNLNISRYRIGNYYINMMVRGHYCMFWTSLNYCEIKQLIFYNNIIYIRVPVHELFLRSCA